MSSESSLFLFFVRMFCVCCFIGLIAEIIYYVVKLVVRF